jgi:methionyl-tRNA synthetase
MTDKFYITTAIDYVNGVPHIGHAFEKILADAMARWQKLLGKDVHFLIGTDENAQKNVQAAKKAGIDTQDFVNKNAEKFIELCDKLNTSNTIFIRTTDEKHKKIVQELFKTAYEKGDIYKGNYEGDYCEGCEAFKTEKELVEGKCPEHGKKPKHISEETYFFKLSKYEKEINEFVEDYITPEKRKNEIVSRLKLDGLKDISVSRKGLDWGIDVPIDETHKIYVWFDALINYISGANGFWPADLHVVGKDINWFHSVIWPGILFSTKQKLPKKLLVHGFLNLKGEKMSKSTGNILDPIKLIEKYGADVLRYSLLRSSIFEDSDYSEDILIERNNKELADKFGNLISRVSSLAEKYGLEKSSSSLKIGKTLDNVKKHFEKYELDKALSEIFAYVDKCNEYIQEKKPWESKDKKVLYELVNAIKDVVILLSPFIPLTCEKIAKNFGFKISLDGVNKPLKIIKIKKGEILFRKI